MVKASSDEEDEAQGSDQEEQPEDRKSRERQRKLQLRDSSDDEDSPEIGAESSPADAQGARANLICCHALVLSGLWVDLQAAKK